MRAVELNSVHKSFGPLKVLSDCSLSLERGKFYALLGSNGAGKSTLMRILMRQESFDQGSGQVLGVPFSTDSAELNSRVGYVSEGINYAVTHSLKRFFKFYGSVFPRWDEKAFFETLEQLDLDPSRTFGVLSRGQKMRVAFAAAWAMRPELLLLDEITSVLDAGARAYLMRKLSDFVKAGGTVVLATNIVTEINEVAHRLLLLDEGQIRVNSDISELGRLYRKIRRPPGSSHPVFSDPKCVELALNSDQSVSYLLAEADLKALDLPPELMDHRQTTAEEVFVYFTKKNRVI